MSRNSPIGLFDSGVGGLSIYQEIKKTLPNESFVFVADQLNVPYGAKSKKELNKLTENMTKFLLKFDIKMLVVACNTASCYSIDHLRKKFKIPIVGVVPAIKPATKLTKNGSISVMSTPATAKSDYLKHLIKKYAPQNKVLKLACYGLEDAVEVLDYKKIESLLDKYISKVTKFKSDVIILGCTHYPFLKKEIAKRTGSKVKIIDSGKSVAKRVADLLETKSARLSSKDLFFTTGTPKKFSEVASILLKYEIISGKATI